MTELSPAPSVSRARAFASVRVAMLVVLTLTTGCTEETGETVLATATVSSSPFAWLPLRPASDAPPDEVPGRLIQVSGTEAVVVPPMPAHLLRLLVKPGDRVAENAAVAEVVMPQVDSAVASLTTARNALRILQQRRDRMSKLAKDGLVRAADVSSLDLDIARHNAERLQAQAILSGARLTKGGTVTLRTPIAGVVTEARATVGELRRPEDGPIARIRSPKGQRVEANFAARLPPNATFAFQSSVGAVPLTLVNEITAPQGFGMRAWFEAPADVEISVAAEGRVQVLPPSESDAWYVPAMSVGAQEGKTFVVVQNRGDAGTPRLVWVEVLRTMRSDAVIRAPLEANALVAADPSLAASRIADEAKK